MTHVRNPWEIYDRLIEGVPADVRVVDACVGSNWTSVAAESGAGVAYTFHGGVAPAGVRDVAGARLRDVAALVKSWCFEDASLGAAALNAWYATAEKLEGPSLLTGEGSDGFSLVMKQVAAREERPNVCVIGHFPHMEELAAAAHLTVLERRPRKGDLPDAAWVSTSRPSRISCSCGRARPSPTRRCRACSSWASRATVVVTGPSTPMLPALRLRRRRPGRPHRGRPCARPSACATGESFGDASEVRFGAPAPKRSA